MNFSRYYREAFDPNIIYITKNFSIIKYGDYACSTVAARNSTHSKKFLITSNVASSAISFPLIFFLVG